MPDEFELDEFIERLIFLQKLKTGLEQLGEARKSRTKKSVKWCGHGENSVGSPIIN